MRTPGPGRSTAPGRSNNALQAQCLNWNLLWPIGTDVTYWPIRDSAGQLSGTPRRTTTTSTAQILSGHTAVIWLAGISGCVALEHIRPGVTGPSAATRAPR